MTHVIGIVGLRHSNYRSVQKAFEYLGHSVKIVRSQEGLIGITHLVLPGVSSFESVVSELHEIDLFAPIKNLYGTQIKILGLCAGMQVMGLSSRESPGIVGLSWFNFECLPLSDIDGRRLFHTGWNVISRSSDSQFSQKLIGEDFYFNHSFYVSNDSIQPMTTYAYSIFYGTEVVSFIHSENIWGIQFHPEKSQRSGLNLLSNFVNWTL